jgi:hypothetical protein
VDYIFQLTSEEQRRVASSMGRSTASNSPAKKPGVSAKQHAAPNSGAAGGGSR